MLLPPASVWPSLITQNELVASFTQWPQSTHFWLLIAAQCEWNFKVANDFECLHFEITEWFAENIKWQKQRETKKISGHVHKIWITSRRKVPQEVCPNRLEALKSTSFFILDQEGIVVFVVFAAASTSWVDKAFFLLPKRWTCSSSRQSVVNNHF